MKLPILALVAVASAASPAILQRQLYSYPFVQVLPVQNYSNGAPDGFNSLGGIYASSASNLTAQAEALAQKNIALNGTGGIQYSYDIKASISSTLVTVNNLFWQTTIDAEQKVCSIVTSINQQNVGTVQGQLRAGLIAELRAIVAITITLTRTVLTIKAHADAFVDAERAVVASLIQAIATAAAASIGPVAKLSSGLTVTGVSGINDVSQSLASAVASLQAAAKIDWDFF